MKYALIVGNDTYHDKAFRPLTAPVRDVEELTKVLANPDIGAFEVQQLINKPIDTVNRAIERFFRNRSKDDLLLLHFSGHGVLDINGRLHLAVTDTSLEELDASSIFARFISEQMDATRSSRVVLMLDCCHSGAFHEGTREVGGSVGSKQAFEGTGYGRWVLTATDKLQYSWEGPDPGALQPSIFTGAVVEGLKTGKADMDKDGLISVRDLAEYVYKTIVTGDNRQTPLFWTYNEQGKLILAQNPAPQLPDEIVSILRNPYPKIRMGAVKLLGELIESTPNTRLALLARAELSNIALNDDSREVSTAASHEISSRAEPAASRREVTNPVRPEEELQKAKEKAARLEEESKRARQQALERQRDEQKRLEQESKERHKAMLIRLLPWLKRNWSNLVGVAVVILVLAIIGLTKKPDPGPPNQTALSSLNQATASSTIQASSQITIKDPEEYNEYRNAVGQATPTAKAAAIETFLTKYPNSVVKTDMLEQLMVGYQGDSVKMLDAADRLLAVDPENLRALATSVYLEENQAHAKTNPADAQPLLDKAAAQAQTGLSAPKSAYLSDADYQKMKAATAPMFNSAIAQDDANNKDFAGAIAAYTNALKAYPSPDATQAGPGLNDTYLLGQAYAQQTPPDFKNAAWFLTRAAQFAPAQAKPQIEAAAEYFFKKYHGSMDGYPAVQALAKANLFPPQDYNPAPAPPPPSPADLAAQTVASTPDLKTLSLADKEFILFNGKPEDAQKVWDTMKGSRVQVPGQVISATADSFQVAVTEDNKQSKKADFTIYMRTPLQVVPVIGDTVTYDATFDSYTPIPPMIILADGQPPTHIKTR